MEDNSRPSRRTKTRPPDLRRKVLLKNFLREQMSSPVQTSSEIMLPPGSLMDTTETLNRVTDESSQIHNIENLSEDIDSQAEHSSTADDSENIDVENEDDSLNRSTSPFKSSHMFNKISESKLNRFQRPKRNKPLLSAGDLKTIVVKNAVDIENKKVNCEILKLQSSKNAESSKGHKHRFNPFLSPWKHNVNKDHRRKQGITKAKDILQKSKDSAERRLGDPFRRNNISKFSFKFRKVIAAVQDVIKLDGFKKENIRVGDADLNELYETGQNTSSNMWNYPPTSSKHGISTTENKDRRFFKTSFKKRALEFLEDQNTVEKDRWRKYRILDTADDDDNKVEKRKVKQYNDLTRSFSLIRKLENDNKRLREENKLLSESLSNVMSNMDLGPLTKSPLKSVCASKNKISLDIELELGKQSSHVPRCKVIRSMSVQDRTERKKEIKLRLSSQSMCHRQYSRVPPRTLYRAKPCIITPYTPSEEVPLPYPKLSPVLSVSVDCSYAKPVSRRSSMPERTHKRPSVNRRSGFASKERVYGCQNLLSLPSEAFN